MRRAAGAFEVDARPVAGSVARDAFAAALLEHALPVSEERGDAPVVAPQGAHRAFVGTYGDTRLSVTTMAKLMGLLSTFTVSSEDGVLVTRIPRQGEQRWTDVGQPVFAEASGPGRLAFTIGPGGRATHVASWAWRRGAWSTAERLHDTFVALACASLTWQLHHWNLLGIRV